MQKLQGYDEAEALNGNYEILEAGGYICKIVGAREETSKTNKRMLVIAFDINDGEHKDFFKRKFDKSTLTNKKWSNNGIYRQMLEGNENAVGYFKGLITSLEESNSHFKWDWDESKLKGLLFGGVFGREQYLSGVDGTLKFATKLQQIRSVESIKNGDFAIPEDKLLNVNQNIDDGEFITIDDTDDLPF